MSTERAPLLTGPQLPQQQKDEPVHIQPYYIAAVAFLAKLCYALSVTTQVEILLELVCRLYWTYHGDAHAPFRGDRCEHHSVRQYFTILKSTVGILDGLGGLLIYGPMSRLSGRYGRRSAMVLLTVVLILATLCIIGAHRLSASLTAPLLLLWLVLISLAGTWQFDLMTAIYVADTTTPQQRTSSLSIVLGWGYFAGVPGFALGGVVTARTGSNTAVYWIVIALALVLLAFIIFVLPESFGISKRARLQEQWESEQADLGRAGRLESTLGTLFRPLVLLKPHRNAATGRWNLRLLWCGIHAFTSGVASGYIWSAVLIYLALHLGYKPDDNGYVLTTASVATGASLVIVTPFILRIGRPFYSAADPRQPDLANAETAVGSKMDLHLAIFGWIIDAVAVGLFPLARTRTEVIIPMVILGASYFRVSAFRSVVVASGDPVRSGELLAGIQTLTSLGVAFSGLVLGSVLSASINTFPGLVFLVYSAIAFVSVIALCLIHDSDKYMGELA
ncbi:major facilitator superfamily domain-containing protein [Mycena vitilis]|nr:major facilitator superfamily domain-containing protein [Mycena vitilis]